MLADFPTKATTLVAIIRTTRAKLSLMETMVAFKERVGLRRLRYLLLVISPSRLRIAVQGMMHGNRTNAICFFPYVTQASSEFRGAKTGRFT